MPIAFRSRLGATGSGKRFSVFGGHGYEELKGAGGMSRMVDFNVQALANTAWAFAMAAQSDAELFGALARAAG